MKVDYRYAVVDKRTKERVTQYLKTPGAAKGQLNRFFKDGRYAVATYAIELKEVSE